MKEVVPMARMVPMGIDFWASRKSPERLEPAMIPGGAAEKKIINQTSKKKQRSRFVKRKTQLSSPVTDGK